MIWQIRARLEGHRGAKNAFRNSVFDDAHDAPRGRKSVSKLKSELSSKNNILRGALLLEMETLISCQSFPLPAGAVPRNPLPIIMLWRVGYFKIL